MRINQYTCKIRSNNLLFFGCTLAPLNSRSYKVDFCPYKYFFDNPWKLLIRRRITSDQAKCPQADIWNTLWIPPMTHKVDLLTFWYQTPHKAIKIEKVIIKITYIFLMYKEQTFSKSSRNFENIFHCTNL